MSYLNFSRLSGGEWTVLSRALALSVALFLYLASMSVQAATISLTGLSKVVAFGDSGTSTNPRITDDLVWIEYLGQSLGVSAESYAIPGAPTSGPAGFDVQITDYLAANSKVADPDAIHFILLGAHDARIGLTPQESHANRLAGMQRLLDNGATKIVVLTTDSYPNMSYSQADIDNYVPDGAVVFNMDPFRTNLADYGITNMTLPCAYNDVDCSVSRLYDYTHPASGFHRALATAIEEQLTAVPLPGAIWLFGSAVIGLVARRSVRH